MTTLPPPHPPKSNTRPPLKGKRPTRTKLRTPPTKNLARHSLVSIRK